MKVKDDGPNTWDEPQRDSIPLERTKRKKKKPFSGIGRSLREKTEPRTQRKRAEDSHAAKRKEERKISDEEIARAKRHGDSTTEISAGGEIRKVYSLLTRRGLLKVITRAEDGAAITAYFD